MATSETRLDIKRQFKLIGDLGCYHTRELLRQTLEKFNILIYIHSQIEKNPKQSKTIGPMGVRLVIEIETLLAVVHMTLNYAIKEKPLTQIQNDKLNIVRKHFYGLYHPLYARWALLEHVFKMPNKNTSKYHALSTQVKRFARQNREATLPKYIK